MALPPVAADTLVSVTTTKVPAPTTSESFGVPCLITTDVLDGSSRYLEFTTVEGIDAAETATYISSATAAAARLVLNQDQRPVSMAVINYIAPEVPSDGLEDAIGEGLDVGAFELRSATEATINTLATWLAASASRKSRYLMVFQTADSGAYGGSKPAALTACEQLGVKGFYSADAQYLAAAYLGKLSGHRLVGSPTAGPVGSQVRITGVTPTTALTAANLAALAANDFAVLQPMDHGASATERIIVGTKAYDGSDWSSSVSLVYAGRQCRAAALGVWMDHAISGTALKANGNGIAEAEAAIYAVLKPMADAGHFTPNAVAPLGFSVTGSVSGTIVVVDVVLYLAGEATSFSVPIVGQEV